MKKYISFMVMVGLMFSFSLVKAEEGDTRKTERQTFKEERQNEREAFRGEMEAKREAFRETMGAERKAFMDNLKAEREQFMAEVKAKREEFRLANSERKATFCRAARNMMDQRFESAVRNLERFQERIAGIIEDLIAEEDTSLAEESLELSRTKLTEAEVKIAEIRELVPEDCNSLTPVTPEVFEQIKLGARDAKNMLKESKEALRETVLAVKDLLVEDDEDEDDEGEDEEGDDEENGNEDE